MKKAIWLGSSIFLLVVVLGTVIGFYPYLFSKTLYGEMLSVEKVGPQTVITGDKALAFSYAIAIRDQKTNSIFTASSEDRQWAAWEKLSATKGTYCVEARLYPYPPWDMVKAGTYHDARLLKVSECAKGQGG